MAWTGTNPLQMAERSSDPAAIANNGQLYTKESSSRTELFFEDDAGNITQITKAGQLNSAEFSFPLLAPNGTAAAPSYSFSGATNYGLTYASSTLYLDIGGALRHQFDDASYYLTSDSAVIYLGVSSDVRLYRDAAAVLALKNGVTSQELRIYGTTTGPKYLRLLHDGTDSFVYSQSGTMYIGTPSGSSAFAIVTGGTTRWTVDAGHLYSGGNYRFSHGTSALATTATDGFFHLNTCAGAPTGVPASIPTGQVPMVFDTTNSRLYIYHGAAWHYIAQTA